MCHHGKNGELPREGGGGVSPPVAFLFSVITTRAYALICSPLALSSFSLLRADAAACLLSSCSANFSQRLLRSFSFSLKSVSTPLYFRWRLSSFKYASIKFQARSLSMQAVTRAMPPPPKQVEKPWHCCGWVSLAYFPKHQVISRQCLVWVYLWQRTLLQFLHTMQENLKIDHRPASKVPS